jgi:hypothetical protein
MSTIALTNHARHRMVEFGIGLDVVADIVTRPDRTHTNTVGQRVCVADAHPDWTVVVGHGDVVVTVLRRTAERWEHEPAPARARAVSSSSTSSVPTPTDETRRPEIRRRSSSMRRPVPTQARGAVVSTVVDPDVLRLAHALADGDPRRLQINRDGSVTILNRARGTR